LKYWLNILVNLVFYGSIAVAGYLLLQVFLLVSFKVPTNSVLPTLMQGTLLSFDGVILLGYYDLDEVLD